MKLSSSILFTALNLYISSAQAAQVECLDERRYNLESMCRHECSKLDSAAFTVSYAEDSDACNCFPKIEGGEYTGTGDQGKSQLTCYSMADAKTRVIDYGDCIFVGNDGIAPTSLVLKKCPRHEPKAEVATCLDEMRYNLESMCRNECTKHDSAAFSVSYDENNDSCRCFPKLESSEGAYNGTGDRQARLTCYSMGGKIKLLDYGDCAFNGFILDETGVETYTLKRCPVSGDRLRRRVLA